MGIFYKSTYKMQNLFEEITNWGEKKNLYIEMSMTFLKFLQQMSVKKNTLNGLPVRCVLLHPFLIPVKQSAQDLSACD